MSVLSILLDWVSSLTDPMKAFRTYAADLNGIHNEALQAFRELVYKLDPNQALQQNTIISGDFATAIEQTALDFLALEEHLSLFADQYNKLLEIADELEAAVAEIEGSVETTALALEADSVLLEITADVDIAAVAEGGANPIADVAGFILTIIAGAAVLDALKNLAEDIYHDVQNLKNDLHSLELATYPPTVPEPKHNPINQPKWKQDPVAWLSNPTNQANLNNLMNSYGYLGGNIQGVLMDLLQMGLSPAQITTIMSGLQGTGASNDEILKFLNGIVNGGDGAYPDSPSPAALMAFFAKATAAGADPPLSQIVNQYAGIADIPGANRLLERIIISNGDANAYRGYLFELGWVNQHKDQIARVEDVALNSKGKNAQAADVIFKSAPFTKGAVVDIKSYNWNVPSFVISMNEKNMLKQVDTDKANYPGYPLVYVFNTSSKLGTPPQSVINALTAKGVTVMTSPPDKVVGVGAPPEVKVDPGDVRIPLPEGPGRLPLPGGGDEPLPLPPGN